MDINNSDERLVVLFRYFVLEGYSIASSAEDEYPGVHSHHRIISFHNYNINKAVQIIISTETEERITNYDHVTNTFDLDICKCTISYKSTSDSANEVNDTPHYYCSSINPIVQRTVSIEHPEWFERNHEGAPTRHYYTGESRYPFDHRAEFRTKLKTVNRLLKYLSRGYYVSSDTMIICNEWLDASISATLYGSYDEMIRDYLNEMERVAFMAHNSIRCMLLRNSVILLNRANKMMTEHTYNSVHYIVHESSKIVLPDTEDINLLVTNELAKSTALVAEFRDKGLKLLNRG